MLINCLDGVNDSGIGLVYGKNASVQVEKCEYDFGNLFNGTIMVYLHQHVLLHLGTVDFNRVDTGISAIDILVSIFGFVCTEYDITSEISFGM